MTIKKTWIYIYGYRYRGGARCALAPFDKGDMDVARGGRCEIDNRYLCIAIDILIQIYI